MKARAIALLILAASLLVAQAQTTTQGAAATKPPAAATAQPAAATPAPPPLSPTEQTIQDIKNPVSWMSWGADMRIREEIFDNLLTLNQHDADNLHLQNYLRFRGRIWTSVKPVDDLSFNVRLTDEAREWLRPAGYTAFKPRSGFDVREGVFDNVNAQWRNILSLPMTATVGRQDYLPGTPSGLGDGWLVGDGTPFDGSWTYFLDSAKVAYDLKDQHTTIQAIGIIQDAHDDGWMPTLNNQNLFLTEQNEKGAILWVGNKSLPEVNLDGYFIYKEDSVVHDLPFGSKFRPDNANIYTVGGRASGLVADHWKYSAEGAYQFGRKQDPSITFPSSSLDYREINSFGVNSKVAYLFKDKLNNQLSLSYEFLTGDDPNSKDDEMFDNLWGRWPRWSEIGLYSFAAETRIGQEANMHRIGPGWTFNPVKNMEFSAAYYALIAQQDVATRGAPNLFAGNVNALNPAASTDHGIFRGHFAQVVLKYKFSKHVNAHLWAEFEFPGDYYVHHATMYFLRPEIMFTF